MRFDFFRRSSGDTGANPDLGAGTDGSAQPDAGPDGHVAYAMLLDAQRRVMGYRMAWRAAGGEGSGVSGAAGVKALMDTLAMHLNPTPAGWLLGPQLVFVDVTVDALFQSELQSLPPQHMVLCMGVDELLDADMRSILLFLREQGFGFMLCGATALPEDPELRAIVTHFEVDARDADTVARLRRDAELGHPPVEPIASRVENWDEFDACAGRRVNVFIEGAFRNPPVRETEDALQPESLLIVQLMQMLQRNEDVRVIEAALKHDAALTYRLLRYINSPSVGMAVEIHSLRHAVAMLGYSPLYRWLSLLLATSNKGGSPFMMKKAILRGRFVELMGQGMLPASEADNLFVAGMFSLLDQLLGVSMEGVLRKVQLTESVQQAILSRGGLYGPFVALAESCELDDGQASRLSEALFLSADQVNAAQLSALVWAQDASPVAAGP
ncbi:EAL and modified HD-GYP domain-containing signal transduction protein [Variovorax sp. YR752]|jgi:EAL and modified HD-GYP domain-containing signal transduction protein|uniref:EAL and HDOD domain-containing protein n=1 Tax=Variovorax sp. YR752 TaxID=1884383 RepID=UPI000BD45454|nr:HDOD domain-containing protein [Variovorax sp. YR752]SOD25501.1 EAL and modified HD-GYP domain-containing signal transduction protein [Variovorax sp. YR752]